MKRVIFSEGAGFLHAICRDHSDALKWLGKFRGNDNFRSVELNASGDVVLGAGTRYNEPYRYVVSAEKHGWWSSDEPPFRAGLGMLFRRTVMSSVEESKLISAGVISRVTE